MGEGKLIGPRTFLGHVRIFLAGDLRTALEEPFAAKVLVPTISLPSIGTESLPGLAENPALEAAY